ncbi:hypothetical protein [Campylobacter gastrosuis]|uniref:Uncharacterized protein n=1 Tax=Campylobacter gastrosuis TaxID=2974576 RepID=A0ABT7HQX0_9BACT|nr:hypothetical protein [Campylobacter gastrosuis]MDL0089306.1 hypothetical protein [Campylobacter gastrosuis]
MVTETYNQAEYNKDGMNGVEIFKKGVMGGGVGFGISGAGKIGNNIIIKNGVVGKPINYDLKTLKNEFEGVAGVGGAVIPNYFMDNKSEK